MLRAQWITIALLLATNIFAELAIVDLKYDKVTDDLVIHTKFPGKCLPHELSLRKVRHSGHQTRFLLSVTNDDKDPCSGINEKIGRFPMDEILVRPAQIFVSTNADGSKPHVLKLPVYPEAHINKVEHLGTARPLRVTLTAGGQVTRDRFYLDTGDRCFGSYAPTCDAFIRDKAGYYNHEKSLALKQTVDLNIGHLSRPINLYFHMQNGQVTHIHLP